MGGTVAASKAAEQRDRPERANWILLWVPSVPFARPVIPDVRHPLPKENDVNEQQTHSYATHLNVQFPALSLVDVPSLVKECTDRWYNQTLCKVNDSVIRLGVMQGEYHWHKHDNDDEFFFVLEGHFIIDLEDRSIGLQPQEGFVVPKGVVHRTRAPDRAVILMVETAAIIPTGCLTY